MNVVAPCLSTEVSETHPDETPVRVYAFPNFVRKGPYQGNDSRLARQLYLYNRFSQLCTLLGLPSYVVSPFILNGNPTQGNSIYWLRYVNVGNFSRMKTYRNAEQLWCVSDNTMISSLRHFDMNRVSSMTKVDALTYLYLAFVLGVADTGLHHILLVESQHAMIRVIGVGLSRPRAFIYSDLTTVHDLLLDVKCKPGVWAKLMPYVGLVRIIPEEWWASVLLPEEQYRAKLFMDTFQKETESKGA